MGVGAAQEGVADRSVGSVVAAVGLSRRCWSPRKRRQKQQRSCVRRCTLGAGDGVPLRPPRGRAERGQIRPGVVPIGLMAPQGAVGSQFGQSRRLLADEFSARYARRWQ